MDGLSVGVDALRALARADQIFQSLPRISAPEKVMREDTGRFFCGFWELSLNRLADPLVNLPSRDDKEARVSNVFCECVLEDIEGIWMHAPLVDQFGLLQRRETGDELHL